MLKLTLETHQLWAYTCSCCARVNPNPNTHLCTRYVHVHAEIIHRLPVMSHNNFRRISNLPFIWNIIEIIVCQQLFLIYWTVLTNSNQDPWPPPPKKKKKNSVRSHCCSWHSWTHRFIGKLVWAPGYYPVLVQILFQRQDLIFGNVTSKQISMTCGVPQESLSPPVTLIAVLKTTVK